MKPTSLIPFVLFIVCLFVFASSLARSDEWSPSQLQALSVLQAAVDAEKRGKVEELAPLYHERFVAWDLSQASPLNRAAFLDAEAEFLKEFKVIDFQMTPVAIEIADATAVVNVTYTHTLVNGNGEQVTTNGRWSATLVKKGSKWLFLNCIWIDIK